MIGKACRIPMNTASSDSATPRGEILSCLFDTPGSSLLSAWDGNALAQATADRILQVAVLAKPQMGSRVQTRPMISIGG
ncbi:MAG: hypothetical protein V1929_04255 [bacterium]